jgi:hypothetical protein
MELLWFGGLELLWFGVVVKEKLTLLYDNIEIDSTWNVLYNYLYHSAINMVNAFFFFFFFFFGFEVFF